MINYVWLSSLDCLKHFSQHEKWNSAITVSINLFTMLRLYAIVTLIWTNGVNIVLKTHAPLKYVQNVKKILL